VLHTVGIETYPIYLTIFSSYGYVDLPEVLITGMFAICTTSGLYYHQHSSYEQIRGAHRLRLRASLIIQRGVGRKTNLHRPRLSGPGVKGGR
jgi:hypothetical protein